MAAQTGISGKTLGVIFTVFTIVNLFGGAVLRPYLENKDINNRQDTEIQLIQQRQSNIEKQIEDLKNDNKADHNNIQGKLGLMQNSLLEVVSDVKHLLRSTEDKKTASFAVNER